MISKAFNLALFLVISSSVFSQITISGIVTDTQGAPILGAEVYVRQTQTLSITEEDGRFIMDTIEPGIYDIVVFAYGFRVLEETSELSESRELQFQLEALEVQQLSEVVLTQEREKVFALQKLKTVEGTAIYAGKKSEVVLVGNIPGNLAANNPRQIYNQVVGLNIFDYGDAGLQLNIGGRGLDPNRTANFNVRQNGYDISADALGYPESYYTPPAEALDQIQVVRGAASLQYGPQFGGLINFKFKKPNPNKKIEWVSRQTLGSFDLFTSFNSLSGTVGDFSYYTYFNYKEGNGFRPNSNFNSRNYFGNFGYQLSDKTKISFEATFLNYLAKQPGGLTDVQFLENPDFSNRDRNWFNVDWKLFSLRLEHQFSSKTDFSLNLFTLDAARKALGFRTNRVSQPDNPDEPRELLVDNFQNWGGEARVLNRYQIKEKDAVLLLGIKYYQTSNDQRQGPGTTEDDPNFEFVADEFPNFLRQAQFEFPNLNLAFFGENIFRLSDKFSLTPGFRFEYIKTESEGFFRRIEQDLAGNTLLNEELSDNRNFERNFLLLGLGASYNISPYMELYANVSENYRSVTFSDIRIVNPSFQIDPNITDESGFTADIGLRGKWQDILSYDISAYGLFYNNRLGEALFDNNTGRTIRARGNIGDAFIYGLENFVDWNVVSTFWSENKNVKLNIFTNVAFTKSEYTAVNLLSLGGDVQVTNLEEGNEVEFIPEINLKTGVSFGYGNLLGSIQYTYLSEQFTDATNALQDVNDNQRGIEGTIPAYDIMDLSLSYTYKKFRLEAGINNVLDNSFFTRRATGYPGPGIIPAEPRTFYTTLQVKL
ncbi:MAG: TonB-dependent receptor [Bacteroidota bacterium]